MCLQKKNPIQQDQTARNISVATPRGSVLRWDILIWWNLLMTPSSTQGRRKLGGWVRHLYAGHLHPQGVASCNRGRVDIIAESTPSTLIAHSTSTLGLAYWTTDSGGRGRSDAQGEITLPMEGVATRRQGKSIVVAVRHLT